MESEERLEVLTVVLAGQSERQLHQFQLFPCVTTHFSLIAAARVSRVCHRGRNEQILLRSALHSDGKKRLAKTSSFFETLYTGRAEH